MISADISSSVLNHQINVLDNKIEILSRQLCCIMIWHWGKALGWILVCKPVVIKSHGSNSSKCSKKNSKQMMWTQIIRRGLPIFSIYWYVWGAKEKSGSCQNSEDTFQQCFRLHHIHRTTVYVFHAASENGKNLHKGAAWVYFCCQKGFAICYDSFLMNSFLCFTDICRVDREHSGSA